MSDKGSIETCLPRFHVDGSPCTVSADDEKPPTLGVVPSPDSVSVRMEVPLKPEIYFTGILRASKLPSEPTPTLSEPGFWNPPTESQVLSYDCAVLTAVRNADVAQLRSFLNDGRDLTCCNNFGESLTHMACRRGYLDVVRFLVDEANVTVSRCDDFGRTPLHDAFWTVTPNFELVKMLLTLDRRMMVLSDKRGHTPLGYAREEHWESWCQFLDDNKATFWAPIGGGAPEDLVLMKDSSQLEENE
jgi:hypothetical protein